MGLTVSPSTASSPLPFLFLHIFSFSFQLLLTLSVIFLLSSSPPCVSTLSPHGPSTSQAKAHTPTQCSPLLPNYLWPVIWIICYSLLLIVCTCPLHLLQVLHISLYSSFYSTFFPSSTFILLLVFGLLAFSLSSQTYWLSTSAGSYRNRKRERYEQPWSPHTSLDRVSQTASCRTSSSK